VNSTVSSEFLTPVLMKRYVLWDTTENEEVSEELQGSKKTKNTWERLFRRPLWTSVWCGLRP